MDTLHADLYIFCSHVEVNSHVLYRCLSFIRIQSTL